MQRTHPNPVRRPSYPHSSSPSASRLSCAYRSASGSITPDSLHASCLGNVLLPRWRCSKSCSFSSYLSSMRAGALILRKQSQFTFTQDSQIAKSSLCRSFYVVVLLNINSAVFRSVFYIQNFYAGRLIFIMSSHPSRFQDLNPSSKNCNL